MYYRVFRSFPQSLNSHDVSHSPVPKCLCSYTASARWRPASRKLSTVVREIAFLPACVENHARLAASCPASFTSQCLWFLCFLPFRLFASFGLRAGCPDGQHLTHELGSRDASYAHRIGIRSDPGKRLRGTPKPRPRSRGELE